MARAQRAYTAAMSALEDAPQLHVDDRATWHLWLEANHAAARGVWLITWRPRTGRPRLEYEDMIEEALCYGWVDGTGGVLDEERGRLYFAPRKPRSVWAASHKARVEKLIAEGRMTAAGMAAIERAKANGSWEVLESSDRLEVPEDRASARAARPQAAANFAAFTPSQRKMQLAWIAMARRPETRAGRIEKIAEAAARNERAFG